MGQVIAEIRILDGTETVTWYAIWDNTTDGIEQGHPLFEDRRTAELYLKLYSNHLDMRIELSKNYHSITYENLIDWMTKKLLEV